MIRLNMRFSLVLESLLLISFLVGCISETEQFIQGYWYRGDVHFMDQWSFDRGNYNHVSGIFDGNDRRSSGYYHIIDIQDASLTLELDDRALSFNDERPQIVVKLDLESDTIRIRGDTFERILP